MLVMCEKEVLNVVGVCMYGMLVSHVVDYMSLCRLECLLVNGLMYKG